ncbi:monocarboxylate transporter 12-like isoform X1 [Centruroides sculpturatus]|uniref:monocarboxylate transporter 12-like isoform X1 n=1 Tax=Centruroides sculpturatus TaxID=218467 RepID=UPI000C6E9E99|nr:monocarboxylate transporter 12-like isoform X1 [Centruroides sculpturatus]XP_023233495.1 monocarboxylate transporter 12-like isoform X2 [Centruroides sculpturatus]XP_023233504.1 monocarboxylate transporter 12-like isoform X1 [Centruroides sculpturatus]
MKTSKQRESAEHSSDSDVSRSAPPDGGWGWMVVFSSFMIHVVADGVTYTFGIFYGEFLKYFGESKGTTAWVASIMVGTTFCIGPVASGLTNKYGCRAVTILGSLLATSGLLLSVLAPSVAYLYFTIGLCTGAGFGLMYLPSIVSVTCYFEKKRAFATGVAVCGSGMGTFALAPLTEYLVESYGWKGSMLIISGLVLNCCVFGSLFRSLDTKPSKNPEKLECNDDWRLQKVQPNNNYSFQNHEIGGSHSDLHAKSNLPLTRFKSDIIPEALEREHSLKQRSHLVPNGDSTPLIMHKQQNSGILYRKDIFYSGSLLNLPDYKSNPNIYRASIDMSHQCTNESEKPNRCCPREMTDAFSEMLDASLLRNVIFIMFGLSNFFTNIGFNVPYVYTKVRANALGITDEHTSILLSVIGISNTVGRVALGYLSDRKWVNRLFLYNASLTICGLATAFSCYCTTYTTLVIYSAIFGGTAGAYVSLTSVILVDLLGLEKLTNAFGLLLVFEGIACLMGPPITGWLYDGTGSYDPGFYVSGFMIALSGIMLFFIPCIKTKTCQETPANDEETATSI